MKHLLVCTIMRNQRSNIDTWIAQLCELVQLIKPEWKVEVSVYENDSTDGTYSYLLDRSCEFTLRGNVPYLEASYASSTDVLGTAKYGSVWSIDRLRNLAAARQRCLYHAGDLNRFDKIAYIEPDVIYDPKWCSELILARHPISAGLGEPDIYSGWSLRPLSNPKESVYLYDTCATRAGCDDTCWDVNESCGTWRAGSLVRTDLGGVNANCLHRVWSTFNCFCVYNAKPFKEGARWGIVNKRINPSGIEVEGFYLDADTVNICEQFRERGYGGIYLNTNCLVRHN